jgi:transposase
MLRVGPPLSTDSSPRSCGSASNRCCRHRRPALAAASRAVCRTATASPRSSSWPAPRPRGACCQPRNWAAARPPPAGDAWTSGPAPGCSSNSGRSCWTNSVPPAGSTWNASVSTPSACGRSTGDLTGATPVDRGKQGSKLHLAGERGGLPLSVVLSAANANDATMFEALLDDIPAIRMPTGRRRRRPTKVHADKAYDHRRCRAYLPRRGIRPRIARRRIEPSDRLGRHRWRIERTGAWLGGWRRLRIRYERDSERFYAMALLACSVICFNALQRPP